MAVQHPANDSLGHRNSSLLLEHGIFLEALNGFGEKVYLACFKAAGPRKVFVVVTFACQIITLILEYPKLILDPGNLVLDRCVILQLVS